MMLSGSFLEGAPDDVLLAFLGRSITRRQLLAERNRIMRLIVVEQYLHQLQPGNMLIVWIRAVFHDGA